MFVRTRWVGIRTGYDIGTDLPYGFTLALGTKRPQGVSSNIRFRWFIKFHYDWPKVVWADRYWRVNESGTLKGVPVPREQTRLMAMVGLRYWPKTMIWRRCFKVSQFD